MKLKPFVDALPIPKTLSPKTKCECHDYYEVGMEEFEHKFHRDLEPTKIWGYEGQFPGPVIDVNRGKAAHVKWMNDLPDKHLLPIDRTLHGSGEHNPEVRTVVHLHGAEVEPEYDGYPEDWFSNDYKYVGPCFKDPVYKYNNKQRAGTLWYHDHAVGITRLNVYAGLAGMYIIRDDEERSLNLPKGKYELPLIIADKGFNEDGSLFYPEDTPVPPLDDRPDDFPIPSVTPGEAFENITVNGKVWPYFEVERRKYRFRILNVSNERFYRIALDSGQPLIQIGSDGGLIEHPVEMKELLIAPAERMDVIIDFSNQPAGTKITMTNTAPVPFGLPSPPAQDPDPETDGQIMQFHVIDATGKDNSEIPERLSHIRKIEEDEAIIERDITLDVATDEWNRLKFLLNNKEWHERIDVKPKLGDTEIWRFINSGGAVHPMHIHLIQFQVLDRIPFDGEAFDETRNIHITGKPVPPAPNERGWKDVVHSPPGFITRVIMRFGPFTGRYVYHCHILEHEDHDMMRPFEVVAPDEDSSCEETEQTETEQKYTRPHKRRRARRKRRYNYEE